MQFLNSQPNLDKYGANAKKQGSPRTQREELIEICRKIINLERIGTKYKPINHMGVKMKVLHLSDHELFSFIQECRPKKEGDTFSKPFFGRLKVTS